MNSIDEKKGEKFIVLTVSFRQEGNKWLARCIELGTSMFGNTFEDAQEALKGAIDLHLNTLEDVHECERFFNENNIKVYNPVSQAC
jgi:predicted RNase H-like HicB family nuclease